MNVMTWQIFILLSVIFYSVSIIIQKKILKDKNSNPIAFAIIFQLLVGIFIALYGFIFAKISFENFSSLFVNFIFMVVLYAILNIFIVKSMKQTEASKFTIIFATRALFATVISLIFLKEALLFRHIIGALLIFSGIMLSDPKSLKLSFGKGEMFAFLAALFFGFATVNDRFVLKQVNVYSYSSAAFILPAILTGLIYPGRIKDISVFLTGSFLPKIIFLCTIFAANSVFFYLALQRGDSVSQVNSAGLISVIVIVLLSVIFLKERTNMAMKIIGSVVSFVGLFLVS